MQIVDVVEALLLLVICLYLPPGGFGNVGALKHDFLDLGAGLRDSRSIGLTFHCLSGK